jgi:hypothetical protein
LLEGHTEQSLLDSDSKNENSYAPIYIVMNDGNDDKEMKGDANDKDFEWEVMPNYRGQRELFIAEYEFQGAAANILNYFSPKHLQKMKSI